MKRRTSNRGRLLDVEDGGHALPFGEALFEPQHFVLEYANFLGDMNKLGVAVEFVRCMRNRRSGN